MRKKRKGADKNKIQKVGLLLLLFSVILLAVIQIIKYYKNSKDSSQQMSETATQQEVGEVNNEPTSWSKYENEDYQISFDYPYLLHKVEYEEPGEYDYFVVFEENQFSKEKGIAFGVSSDGLEKEVERIKTNILEQGGSKLVKDEKYEDSCLNSWILEYESEDESMESRSFFIFERGDYTFSFSTVPEQIQRLRNSIGFSG